MGINPTPNGSGIKTFMNFSHTNGVTFEVALSPVSTGSNADKDSAIEDLVTHLAAWGDIAPGPIFQRYEELQYDVTP